MRLGLVTLLVEDYDAAIAFYCDVLGFDLVEDSAATTTSGSPKRWVVVRAPGGGSGLLLAKAEGPDQAATVGRQFAGRVGLFLEVDDVEASCRRLHEAGVEIVRPPRREPYGTVAVFRDPLGNLWDLLGRPDG